MAIVGDNGPPQSGWRSPNVWAKSDSFDGNSVKQLLVPSSIFSLVSGTEDALEVANNHGAWPASTPGRAPNGDSLWAQIPLGSSVGASLNSASWHPATNIPRHEPTAVLESYSSAITFNEGTDDQPGLRSPQLGALHAVLGFWTTRRTIPATVVMPTGTGKTETMLALLVAARPERLLVLVPSDALRHQVAAKFNNLGVLQELGVVTPNALRPVVGLVEHSFSTASTAAAFAAACNVVVTTASVLHACAPDVVDALVTECSHLFIDEAHHVAANTWASVRDAFGDKPIVQFTATPFREDGKHLAGRTVYSFPLREAQRQGYFSRIDYAGVIDFDDVDQALAQQSVTRLRTDLAAGFDHVLMVRVRSVDRAKEVLPYYEALASDLQPAIVNSRMSQRSQKNALMALRARSSRVIVCVNMLGEGFDLPALKVAAIHDPQKSLGVALQFIGRFARTSSNGAYGTAAMFVARTEIEVDKRLRSLYAEDADWNLILRNLTEAAVQAQQDVSDFEEGFTSLPEDVALRSLLPKLSTVVYRAPTSHWDPQQVVDFFGEDNLLTTPIGLNAAAGVAWFVVENRQDVRWGNLKTIEEVTYELYVLYFDAERKLLYVNNSANSGVFEDLATEVLGQGATRFTGSTVYRVMADIQRLVPTNVGVLDAHDQFRRFSMHVGSDVTASFSQAEAGTKSQTNISGGGWRDGEYVNISASLKGRIWSHAAARNLKHWCDWCDSVGAKLLDDTINIDHVIGQFILPENLTSRPDGVLLAVEWPWQIHLQQAETLRLSFEGNIHEAVFTDLTPRDDATTGPFTLNVTSGSWTVGYEARVERGRLQYACSGPEEIKVVRPRSEQRFSEWLNDNGLMFILDGDRIIERDLLYKPTWDKPIYGRDKLTPLDWSGTTITIESQTEARLTDSIQYRVISDLKADTEPWAVVLDDDGRGEVADIVAMRIDSEGLLVRLVHCKFSHAPTPGARVADLYEVCGQAQKSIMWRRSDLRPFFKALDDRARKKKRRTGVDPFEVGDIKALYELQEKALVLRRRVEIVIAQPGLSVAQASSQQLDLLASTEAYLRTTINAPLYVLCSE